MNTVFMDSVADFDLKTFILTTGSRTANLVKEIHCRMSEKH